MTALCAAATALLLAGLLVDGWPGTALLILAAAGNTAWLAVTFVRWWRWASQQTRLTVFAATVGYIACWFVIRVAAGPLAAWVLGLAGIGYVATVTGALATTGYLAVRHGMVTQQAIAAGKMKEIG